MVVLIAYLSFPLFRNLLLYTYNTEIFGVVSVVTIIFLSECREMLLIQDGGEWVFSPCGALQEAQKEERP